MSETQIVMEAESLEQIPPELHKCYREREHDDGTITYVLEPELAANSVINLFNANRRTREQRDSLKTQLVDAQAKSIIKPSEPSLPPEPEPNPEPAASPVSIQPGMTADDVTRLVQTEVAKKTQAMRDSFQRNQEQNQEEITKLQDELKKRDTTIQMGMTNRLLLEAAQSNDERTPTLKAGYADLFIRQSESDGWGWHNEVDASGKEAGKPARLNPDGTVYIGDDGFTDQTPSEYVLEVYRRFPDMFEPSKGAGAGPSANMPPSNGAIKTRKDLKTIADESAFITEHGMDAFLRLPSG